MQRMRRWIDSKPVPPRRGRSDASRVAVVVGAGSMMALILGGLIVRARPLRSRLQAVPAGLGRASGQFGGLIRRARRATEDGSSVVLPDEDAGDGMRAKAPAARSMAGTGADSRKS